MFDVDVSQPNPSIQPTYTLIHELLLDLLKACCIDFFFLSWRKMALVITKSAYFYCSVLTC